MNQATVLLAILGIAAARPQQNPQDAYIVRYDSDNSGLGGFSFNVETSDGFKHEQQGELQNAGSENESLVVRGSYSYVGDDGKTYTVEYIADENGFQPAGEHLPPNTGRTGTIGVRPDTRTLVGGGLG